MSELKMKDYFFNGGIDSDDDGCLIENGFKIARGMCKYKASAISHAVSSHDGLVEENQRLTAIATKHATRADELYEVLESLISAVKNNTGNEPSLSCYHKAIDDAVDALDKSRIEAEKGDGICN